MCGKPAMVAGGSITALIVNYMLGGGHRLPAGEDGLERGKVPSRLVRCYQLPHTQGTGRKGFPLQECVPRGHGPPGKASHAIGRCAAVVRALAEIRDRRLEERMCPEGQAGWWRSTGMRRAPQECLEHKLSLLCQQMGSGREIRVGPRAGADAAPSGLLCKPTSAKAQIDWVPLYEGPGKGI